MMCTTSKRAYPNVEVKRCNTEPTDCDYYYDTVQAVMQVCDVKISGEGQNTWIIAMHSEHRFLPVIDHPIYVKGNRPGGG